jgi:anthranilate phosphoribosyltransferase
MIQEAIARVVEREHLSEAQAAAAMGAIMAGEVSPALIAALLTALRMKGETVEEVAGFARAMRENAVRVSPRRADLVDTCGTGGGGLRTFNISTTAAFVVAGAGVGVAKHGNRGITSACGSADVLEALGVNLALPPERIAACIDEVGIGFLFAQAHHPAMRHAVPVRRELGFRTLFNLLGPLTNPAGASAQVIGVFHPELPELLAGALARLGCRRAFVVYGLDGLDELSTVGATRVAEVSDGSVRSYELRPEEVGLAPVPPEALADGGDAAGNARLTRDVLAGAPGPRRDVVLLNAAAALVVAGRAADLREGIESSAESIDSGRAAACLDALVRATSGA